MPLSRYPRRGQAIAPRLLHAFLQARAPFGAGRFCDLDAGVWDRYDALTCNRLGRALVAELHKNRMKFQARLGHAKLPVPEYAVQVEDLRLEVLTFNCLHKAEINKRPGGLGGLTVSGALSLRGFGIKSLVDLLTSLESLRNETANEGRGQDGPNFDGQDASHSPPRTRKQIPQKPPRKWRPASTRVLAAICRRRRTVPGKLLNRTLPPLPDGTTLLDLNLPTRTFNLLAQAGYAQDLHRLSVATLRDLIRIHGIGRERLHDLVEAIERLADSAAGPGAPAVTADEEILRLLVPDGDLRRRAIVAARFGLKSRSPATLEAVGKEFDLTRERVRQICSPAKVLKRSAPPPAPLLDSILDTVASRVPASASIIDSDLVSVGLLEKETRIESIVKVAKLLRRATRFAACDTRAGRIVAEGEAAAQVRSVAALTAKLIAKSGAVTMDEIRARAGTLSPASLSAAAIEEVVKCCEGFRWLDEERGSFWLDNGRPNRLRRRIERVLCVAPRIAVEELRAALRRDHRRRGGQIPPARELLELCRQLPECRVDGNDVLATKPVYPLDLLRGHEATIVGLLLEHGPVCQRQHLQELAAEAGIAAPSFRLCLSVCPTIRRYARGVFGLTGAPVPPGQIASLIPPSTRVSALQDHGWTEEGRVWIAYRLSPAAINNGVIRIPADKRPYIEGAHELRTSAGNIAGKLVVRGSFAWGLRRYLRKSGAEAGDILLLEISQAEMVAVARVGDDSLWEKP